MRDCVMITFFVIPCMRRATRNPVFYWLPAPVPDPDPGFTGTTSGYRLKFTPYRDTGPV